MLFAAYSNRYYYVGRCITVSYTMVIQQNDTADFEPVLALENNLKINAKSVDGGRCRWHTLYID